MLGVGGIGLFSSLGKDEILSPCLCGGLSVQGRNSNKEIKSDMFETAGRGLSLYVPGLASSGPGFFRCLLISTWADALAQPENHIKVAVAVPGP